VRRRRHNARNCGAKGEKGHLDEMSEVSFSHPVFGITKLPELANSWAPCAQPLAQRK
jgi:hypothetical protein